MLYLDTETYSEIPIKDGGYKYTENCEVMIATYAFDDGDVQTWDATEEMLMPADLADYLEGDGLITCHNTPFDRNVVANALGFKIPHSRWRCTMMRAYVHGLPGSLDKLSDIYKLGDQAKDKEGKALLLFFCKPQKAKDGSWYRPTRETHPEKWAKFLEYARSDIRAMRQLDKLLPTWNLTDMEYEYWYLDQRSNDRGVQIDVDLAEAAIRAVATAQKSLKAQTQELTDGVLLSTTQRDRTLEYILEAYGVSLPDLTVSTINRRLDDPDLPPEVKELLAIRLQASTTSTAKYKAMLKAVNTDGRVRGMIQFRGAMRTGRDAGRLIQPQNFPSRGLLPQVMIDHAVDLIKMDSADLVFDNVMKATSSALRAALIAKPGYKLVAADLANIEGRYLAWIAGEEWKLQAFRDFDTFILDDDGKFILNSKGDDFLRKGPDLYVMAYARAMGIDPDDVDKAMRQIGKVMELGLGFEGGVGAFLTFAAVYGLDLVELAEVAYGTFDDETLDAAHGFYDWTVKQKRSTFGMAEKVFVTCDCFKRLWRDSHPATKALWKGLQEAVRDAIESPGKVITYGRLKAKRTGAWLRVIMPSGRALCYPFPQVNDKGAISFMGVNQYTRKWERIGTHGGKLVENVVQAGANDIFKHGALEADNDGYPLVFPVHDELVTEVPDSDKYTAGGLCAAMTRVPTWAKGLPLAAEGFEAYRYRK